MSKVVHFNAGDNLKEIVSSNELVLVDFFATWCGPCQMLGPVLDELSEEVDYPIVKVDVDKSPDLAAEHGVRSIPTLVVYKNGEIKTTEMGAKSKAQLISMMNEYK